MEDVRGERQEARGKMERVIVGVSEVSYGMYLSHLLLLVSISGWVRSTLGLGSEGVLGIWTTPVEILLTSVLSFIGVALFCFLIRRIPKVGVWITG